MSVSDEERRDANKTGELVSKKLKEIMDLQADIDALLRDKHPTPSGRSIGSTLTWSHCKESSQ